MGGTWARPDRQELRLWEGYRGQTAVPHSQMHYREGSKEGRE